MRRIERVAAIALTASIAACGGTKPDARRAARATDSAPVSAPVSAPASSAGRVTLHGLDSVRVGETIAQLQRATGETFAMRTGDDPGCRYVRPAALPTGVKVMVVNDTIARLDVDSGAVMTDRDVGIGTADSVARAVYGGTLVEVPNKYSPAPAHDLVVTSPEDSLQRIVFESDGAKVKRFRVGRRPAVDLVEGCG